MTQPLPNLAKNLGHRLLQQGLMLTTAESCTGGLIAQSMTSEPGSSQWFDRGFVTYSNQSKVDLLGVSPDTVSTFGAVSIETVREMAQGALTHSEAQVSIAVTGIAGPSGGTADKPVGFVCFGWALPGDVCETEAVQFIGDRQAIREQAAVYGIERLIALLAP